MPREDAWAYIPEHLARVERAREDVCEGRVYRLGRADLERMIAEAESGADAVMLGDCHGDEPEDQRL